MAKKKSSLGKNTLKTLGSSILLDAPYGFEATRGLLGALIGLKDGGKVRGCGVAKRGFGKAMKRKK
jgi:hypothetical protein